MKHIHNIKDLKKTRKQLRNNLPSTEQKLWSKLRNKQLNGVKFRRQHSIKRYIVDFYAPSNKIAIEIDGDSHYTNRKLILDKNRDEALRKLNIITLRYTNQEINKNIIGVLEDIASHL